MNNLYRTSNLESLDVPDSDTGGAWDEIRKHCSRLTEWGARTLQHGLNGHARTVVIEPEYVCKDYRNIYSNFYSKKFVTRSSLCDRLHFFSEPGLSVPEVAAGDDRATSSYIGYSVVQSVINKDKARGLGRTLIDPFKCGHTKDNFYCLQTTFKTHLHGQRYEVQGYPWMAQSGEATVCAHTAMWTVCRYLSERYNEYAEVYPYDLIEMTGDTGGRRVPYRGMLYTDYSTILSQFGCHPVIIRPRTFGKPKWTDDLDSYLNIYSYVESGFPVLVSFNGHVAAIIGHTLRDTLPATATKCGDGFYNSYSLLDQYVVVDDNFFPYQMLGSRKDDLKRNYGKHFAQLTPHPSKEDIYAAVIPLPEKAFMPPEKARATASAIFKKFIGQIENAAEEAGDKQPDKFIVRLFMTSSNAFKRRKKAAFEGKAGPAPDPLSQFPLRLNLPHFIWVMEISSASLYTGRIVVGEVVLDACAEQRENGLIYTRIGNTIVARGKQKTEASAPCGFHQFTHNLGER